MITCSEPTSTRDGRKQVPARSQNSATCFLSLTERSSGDRQTLLAPGGKTT